MGASFDVMESPPLARNPNNVSKYVSFVTQPKGPPASNCHGRILVWLQLGSDPFGQWVHVGSELTLCVGFVYFLSSIIAIYFREWSLTRMSACRILLFYFIINFF